MKRRNFLLNRVVVLILIASFWYLSIQAEWTAQRISTLNNRANTAMYQGSQDTALRYIAQAIKTDSSNPILWANQALYLLTDDSTFANLETFTQKSIASLKRSYPAEEALRLFRKASALSPRDPVFIHNMAWLYLAGGETDSAKCCLHRVLELAPYDPTLLVSAGMFEEQMNNQSAAIAYYSKSVSVAPELVNSPFFRDLSRREPRITDSAVSGAVRLLERELAQEQNYNAKSRWARLSLYLGDSSTAYELLTDVTKNHPGLNRAWLMLGNIAESRNDSLALTYYQKAKALDTGDPLPLVYLARIYKNIGDHQSANNFRQQALRQKEYAISDYTIRSYRIYQAQSWHNELYPYNLRSWVSSDIPNEEATE